MMEYPAPQAESLVQHWYGEADQYRQADACRILPEEVPIALTYERVTHAVMMATPQNLEDFAYGFTITEGIVKNPEQITGLEIVRRPAGIELRMELADDQLDALMRRRRYMAGPVGCGLCGLESLEAVMRDLPKVDAGLQASGASLLKALTTLNSGQSLHRETSAVHAAGFWSQADETVLVREDVGRHNALDKLGGAMALRRIDPRQGAVVLTSRVSVEMVQKTAMLGVPILVAISAPSALAVRTARAAGITLVARARGNSFDVHSHPHRLTMARHPAGA
ncbi:formate dehydrogenase accessory sulfurtransferase FdhD [Pseudoroseomonas ludipueritiae]|nr:formate dehydrogenase accessory sulfurtransferase FdhD [Pseudoroseomonas ludipueritiae]